MRSRLNSAIGRRPKRPSTARNQISATIRPLTSWPNGSRNAKELARRHEYEGALAAIQTECEQGSLITAEVKLTAILREGALDDRAAQMLREIANRRIADQIEQAENAIARGDFEAGLAAVNVLKASAPPEWSGAIAKVDERGRRAREEALARERQRREAAIASARRRVTNSARER